MHISRVGTGTLLGISPGAVSGLRVAEMALKDILLNKAMTNGSQQPSKSTLLMHQVRTVSRYSRYLHRYLNVLIRSSLRTKPAETHPQTSLTMPPTASEMSA